MEALVFDRRPRYAANWEVPRPRRGEALVRVLLAGICNTDLEIVRGYMEFRGILGHEFVGVVEKGSRDLLGQRVVGEINCPCGRCELCSRGLGNHCPKRTVLGILGRDGAFASYLTLPVKNLHPVPDSLTDEQATFVEPVAAACEVLEQTKVRKGDEVVVLGDGKLGNLVSQILASAGCKVVCVGRHPGKLSLLAARGVRPIASAEASKLRSDLVIECTGSSEGLAAAMEIVRPRGRIVLKSTVASGGVLNLAPLVVNEVTVIGSRCGPFPKAIRALARGDVDVEGLVVATFPLSEGDAAFRLASASGILKVLLAPDAEDDARPSKRASASAGAESKKLRSRRGAGLRGGAKQAQTK